VVVLSDEEVAESYATAGGATVSIAITLTSCVLVLAVNWLGVFADLRKRLR